MSRKKKMKIIVEPVPAEQRDWLYSDSGKDSERGCIGHLRFDTGSSGMEFWTSWWPHKEELNRQPFKEELDYVVNKIKKKGNPIETESYEYLLRLTPFRGDYSYIYCYDKEAQRAQVQDHASVLKKLEELQPDSEPGPKTRPEILAKAGKERPHGGKDAR